MKFRAIALAAALLMTASAAKAMTMQETQDPPATPPAGETLAPAPGPSPEPPKASKHEDRSLEALPQAPANAKYKDRFSGKLVLVLLDDKDHPATRDGRSLWGVERPLTYRPSDGGDTITVPAGFVTDLASIPRWAWAVLPPDGPWAKAAVVHDYLYYTQGTGIWKSHPASITRTKPYSREESDWVLRDAMEDRGVGVFARNVIWSAVRVGGQNGWDNEPGPDGKAPER
jgi:hypothetical protein